MSQVGILWAVRERWAGAHAAAALLAEVTCFAGDVCNGVGAVAAARAVDAPCKARQKMQHNCRLISPGKAVNGFAIAPGNVSHSHVLLWLLRHLQKWRAVQGKFVPAAAAGAVNASCKVCEMQHQLLSSRFLLQNPLLSTTTGPDDVTTGPSNPEQTITVAASPVPPSQNQCIGKAPLGCTVHLSAPPQPSPERIL
jgi:hypothetical protein